MLNSLENKTGEMAGQKQNWEPVGQRPEEEGTESSFPELVS